jgi:hypothetical protein
MHRKFHQPQLKKLWVEGWSEKRCRRGRNTQKIMRFRHHWVTGNHLFHSKSQHCVPISFNAGGSSNFFADEPTALAAAMTDSFCVNFDNDDFGVERMDFEKAAGAKISAMATRSRDDTGIRMISVELVICGRFDPITT